MKKIKLKETRRKYYDEGKIINKCPDCNQELIEEKNNIVLAVRSEKDECELLTNIPISRICTNCPVVVFDNIELEKAARLGIRKGINIEYSVIGIQDLSESETSDRNKEAGEINYEKPKPIIAIKKPKRNDKCPCKSGKKYKKCCLNK